MLILEIKKSHSNDKYILSYIEFLKGIGSWEYPFDNNPENGLTEDEAKYITIELLNTLDRCLENIKR